MQYVDATVTNFPANTKLVGLLVPHVPRHDVDFQVRYSRPRWITAALQGSFVGSAFDNDQNTLSLDHYFLLNALISRPLGHGMEVFVAGENLSNQRYDVARTPYLTNGPPILFRGGFRVTIPLVAAPQGEAGETGSTGRPRDLSEHRHHKTYGGLPLMRHRLNRRRFLKQSATSLLAASAWPQRYGPIAANARSQPRVAGLWRQSSRNALLAARPDKPH